jgi:Lipocalin-like domain
MRMNKFWHVPLPLLAYLLVSFGAFAEDPEFPGTYQLISASRKILESGLTENTYGEQPKGLAMYGKDGHFIILITYDGRPKPESIDKMTDQLRADLHRTMTAYGGTYTFDGSKVTQHLDMSWNEVWTNTTNIRDVQRNGDQIIYTTRPAPFAKDGKMSVVTLVWEKLK